MRYFQVRVNCLFNNYSLSLRKIILNYYFSIIITQVIIRATAFSLILFVSSSETSRNRTAAILKISAYYNHLKQGDYSKK